MSGLSNNLTGKDREFNSFLDAPKTSDTLGRSNGENTFGTKVPRGGLAHGVYIIINNNDSQFTTELH